MLQRKHSWAWRRVAYHAKLVEVRWVVRDGRRVALRKEVCEEMSAICTVRHPNANPPPALRL